MEIEIGNVTLGTIISMLQDGWKIKDFIHRGLDWGGRRVGGDPIWITRSDDPELVLQTAWFELVKDGAAVAQDMAPRRLGGAYFEAGFNKAVFTREE